MQSQITEITTGKSKQIYDKLLGDIKYKTAHFKKLNNYEKKSKKTFKN